MNRRRNCFDDDYLYGSLGMGVVHDLYDSEGPGENVAVIWLPDPEQRKGWREHYVYRKDDEKRRHIGFRPKGKA